MNTKWIMTTAFLAAMAAVAMVRGQEVIPSPGNDIIEVPYGVYDRGSVATDAGSRLYGMGVYARGAGEYNLYTARAMREYQEARARAIQNHKLAVETWFDLKRQNRQFRAKELDPLTPDQLSRAIERQRPARLTAWQYNPVTGSLRWPVALKGKPFESEREALDYAFSSRTSQDSGPDSVFSTQVRQTTEKMLAKLRDRIELFSPSEFMAAKKFLVGLRYEAQSPANAMALASR
ncbi:MAG TPA: hypothetical protein VMP01_26495 [Pirellulaceae bacterium]|nr:hypothetical protein [Pirellulaceae bacterium]